MLHETIEAIIFHVQKAILYNDEEPWMKKEGGSFDVPMGMYDGTEACKLRHFYVIFNRNKVQFKKIGLYRDDGLALLKMKVD